MAGTSGRAARAAGLAEKTILGFIAGAAAAVGVVSIVALVLRVVAVLSGPVTVAGVPTSEPIDAGFGGATFDHVSITTDTLSDDGRLYLIAAAALSCLLALGICAVVAVLCVRIFLGRPFGPVITWGIAVVAILVFLAGLGVPTLEGMAAQQLAIQLDLDQLPVFLVQVDLAPLAWGFALAVVAAAFEIGQRLQRETEGLV